MRYPLFNAEAANDKGLRLWFMGGGNLLSAMVFCLSLAILAKLTLWDLSWGDIICSENGPVERMSAALWFMLAAWCIVTAWRPSFYRVEWLAFSTLFSLVGLRELDVQVWLTGWNLEKLVHYWDPTIPLEERLLVFGLILIPAMVCGAILFQRMLVRIYLMKSWPAPWMGQILVGSLLLVVSLVADKSTHILEFLEIDYKALWISGVEEFSEFVLAAYIVSVIWPYWIEALSETGRTSSSYGKRGQNQF